MIWLAGFIFFFLASSVFHLSNQLNVDFIFSLQNHFQSSLILLEKETENENLAKKMLKFKKTEPKAFVGFLNVNSDLESLIGTPFKNIIVICNERTKFIKKLKEIQNSNSTVITAFIWVHFIRNSNEKHELDSLIIPYNSKFYIVKEIEESRYDIIEIYQMGSNSSKIYSNFAYWENETLKFPSENPFFKSMNLRGFEIQLSTTPLSRSAGSLQIWDLLSEGMNFTYKVASTTPLGGMSQNGTKTGLFKVISDGSVDAGPDDFVVTNERLMYFDFIFPTKIAQAKLYIALAHGMNWSSFTASFKIDIWIATTAWIVLVSIFMLIIQQSINEQHLDDPIFLVITAFCNQGRTTHCRYFSFYICGLMPYLLAIVLFQHYSGILLSYLTVDDSTSPFKNFRDVVSDGTYKISSHYPSFAWFYLNSQNDSNIQKLLVPQEKLILYKDNHYESLCRHRWIHIGTPFNKEIKVNCNLVELPEAFLSYPLGIITKKGFPFKENMIRLVRRLQSNGFLKMHLRDVIQNSKQDFKSIHLGIVMPIFLIFISFTCLAGLMLLCEIAFWKLKNREMQIAKHL